MRIERAKVDRTSCGSNGSSARSVLVQMPCRLYMYNGKVNANSQCQGSGKRIRLNAIRQIHPPTISMVW